jgi:Protein of unknown function (DUF4238)
MMVKSHYIPRHYLNGFTNGSSCIFTYPDSHQKTDKNCKNKGGGRTVQNTAMIHDYYTPQTEASLNQIIESNGSRVLRKILDHEQLTIDDRRIFVRYLVLFLLRGRVAFHYVQKLLPGIIHDKSSVESYMQFIAEHPTIHISYEVYNILVNNPDKIADRQTDVWEATMLTDFLRVHELLLSRHWWVAVAVSPEYFVTSDYPLFYSHELGMKESGASITFPLSKEMALVLEDNSYGIPDDRLAYCSASRWMHNQVHLINLRTVRYCNEIYSPKNEDYVQLLFDQRTQFQDHAQKIVKGT